MQFKNIFSLLTLLLTLTATFNTTHASPWDVDIDARGLHVNYAGAPIIWKSTLYVVKPGWTGMVFQQGIREFKIEKTIRNGKLNLTASDENHLFKSKYNIKVINDTTLRITYFGTPTTDDPAEIECNLGYFNANLFANRPYTAYTKDSRTQSIYPVFPTNAIQVENDHNPNFKKLVFDTRIGKMTIDISTDRQVRFFDARLDSQEWAKPVPLIWCGVGVPARPITKKQPLKIVMTLKVEEDPAKQALPTAKASITPTLKPITLARTYPEKPLLIVPETKTLQQSTGKLKLNDTLHLSIQQPEGETRIVAAAKRILQDYASIKIAETIQQTVNNKKTILILTNSPDTKPNPSFNLKNKWFLNPEGYAISIDDAGITIISSTSKGAFYGLQSLRQIIARGTAGAYAPKLTVTDYPTMKFRGAHWFPSRNGVPFHKKLIERIMAGQKMNYAVIQVDHSQWLSFPKLASDQAVLNSDLKDLVKLCRENFIEPIPLLNVPGHGQWMFQNGQNMDIAEDPHTPFAYCTKNPKSYEFITTLMKEVIDVFKPNTFHLGHDEVTIRGRFPNPECSYCKDETDEIAASRLTANHLAKLTDWLKQRDIKTMIWGDMMLHKGTDDAFEALASSPEAAIYMRDHLSKDITVADWHYNDQGKYPSLDLFKGMGNEVVACTWFKPMNVYLYSQAAKKTGVSGVMQTTWCGYYPTEHTMERDFYQFTAFILAAEYSWSDRIQKPSDLPYTPGDIFNAAYEPRDQRPQDGYTVDLKPVQTIDRKQWVGFAEGWNIAALPKSVAKYESVIFDTTGEKALVLGNSTMSPKDALTKLTLNVDNIYAKHLMLLNASVWDLPRDLSMADITFHYTDGSHQMVQLQTEVNSGGLMQNLSMRKAEKAWTASTPEGREIKLWLTEVANPQPDKTITAITFEPGTPKSGWLLAGLTILK
ncbi:glycoside hydrolase family 20 zincin-like fold domain-containing protein [Poriferisphaera sp. WC338]|uniref:glycoside hydrolase family 20 zincin-like fold domain-containing protein n=1 Tax=Poriferisphaera sp. WC338 TaxID=3425129 RepID=UPI003D81A4CB